MPDHRVATRADFEAAREELLEAEKNLTRLHDDVARKRRDLPWVRVDTGYLFETESGPRWLAYLFGEHSQLIVWHFMFGHDWDEGCPSCSFWADGYDGVLSHLAARDVALVAVSTAPLDRLLDYRQRMGWAFPWVSSGGTSFNRDFEVAGSDRYNYRPSDEPIGELPGFSVFAREGNEVFHTYSAYSRGLDIFNNAYQMLDMVPKGRDEDELPWSMAWLRRHDQYEA